MEAQHSTYVIKHNDRACLRKLPLMQHATATLETGSRIVLGEDQMKPRSQPMPLPMSQPISTPQSLPSLASAPFSRRRCFWSDGYHTSFAPRNRVS